MAFSDRVLPPGTRIEPRRLLALTVLLPHVRRYKNWAAAAVGALVAAALATLAVPLAVRSMIDVGFSTSDAAHIDRSFLALIALAALLAAASAARYYLVTTLGEIGRAHV